MHHYTLILRCRLLFPVSPKAPECLIVKHNYYRTLEDANVCRSGICINVLLFEIVGRSFCDVKNTASVAKVAFFASI